MELNCKPTFYSFVSLSARIRLEDEANNLTEEEFEGDYRKRKWHNECCFTANKMAFTKRLRDLFDVPILPDDLKKDKPLSPNSFGNMPNYRFVGDEEEGEFIKSDGDKAEAQSDYQPIVEESDDEELDPLDWIYFIDSDEILHTELLKQLNDYVSRMLVPSGFRITEHPSVLERNWLNETKELCEDTYVQLETEVYRRVYKKAALWCETKLNNAEGSHGLDLLPLPPVNQPFVPVDTCLDEKIHSMNNPTPSVPAATVRSDNTERKARQAVTLFEGRITEIIKQEHGKNNPMSDKDVVQNAIEKYCKLAVGQNLGATEKSLARYLTDIGKTETPKNYGRQLVRQERGRR